MSELPIIFYPEALEYGYFTVRRHDDGRLEAVGGVPERAAFSRDLLESAADTYCTWNGKRITVALANGSWSWNAKGQDASGRVIYAGPVRTDAPDAPDLAMHTAPADASTTHTPGVLLNHPATSTRDTRHSEAGPACDEIRPLTAPPELTGGRLVPSIVPHPTPQVTHPARVAERGVR